MRSKIIISFTLVMAFLLAACMPQVLPPVATEDPGKLATAVAATVNAQFTQNAVNTLIAELTQAAMATATLEAPSATPLPSDTPIPTNTPVPSFTIVASNTPTPLISVTSTFVPTVAVTQAKTSTAAPLQCNKVQFVSDVTIPDGTKLAPNANFTKTWRLKNAGTCAWTTDYALVFVSGDRMNAPDVIGLGTVVNPGQTVDLSVALKAPADIGSYRGNWQLRSSTGALFGWGTNGDKVFWVDIKVSIGSATLIPGVEFDLAANACAAQWRSSTGMLVCPSGSQNFNNGSITYTDTPMLEGGYQDDQMSLITIPSSGAGGYIQGTYPEVRIYSGDIFRGLVGCLDESPNCNVTFQLNYSSNGGPIKTLRSWTEVSDGKFTELEVNLVDLIGNDVAFILVVQNNSTSTDDRAFWLAPRIAK